MWLAMAPRFERINDARSPYATVGSVMLGPLLLAALTSESYELRADPAAVADWVVVAARPPQEVSTRPARLDPWAIWGRRGATVEEAEVAVVAVGKGRNYTLRPLSRIARENYTAFLNVSL